MRTLLDRLPDARGIARGAGFLRGTTVLTVGAVTAQLIALAFAPVLTRTYDPEAFGVFGTLMALVAVGVPVFSLSLPLAVVLPADERDARGLGLLCLLVAGFFAVSVGIVIALSNSIREIVFSFPVSDGLFGGILVALTIFLGVSANVARQMSVRSQQFRALAMATVAMALIGNVLKLGLGTVEATFYSLIISSLVGTLTFVLVLQCIGPAKTQLLSGGLETWHQGRALLRTYRDFPMFRMPQDLINSASQQLPIFVLALYAGAGTVGLYVLARTVLALPARALSQSISHVFYSHLSVAQQHGEKGFAPLIRATLFLAAVGVVPFGVVFAVAPELFGTLFGREWAVAGVYAQLLVPMLFFHFINSPSVAAVPVFGLQRGLLIYEIVATALKSVALGAGVLVYDSVLVSIALFSGVSAASYVVLIAWVCVEVYRKEREGRQCVTRK